LTFIASVIRIKQENVLMQGVDFMKKKIIVVFAFSILFLSMISCANVNEPEGSSLTPVSPPLITGDSPIAESTRDSGEPALNEIEERAEAFVKWWLADAVVTRLPELDRVEDDLSWYAFSADYSVFSLSEVPSGTYAYAFVNLDTNHISFEEPSLYANRPDDMFPIPMQNGTMIPYKWFSPPNAAGQTWDGATKYVYDHDDIFIIYQEQLRAAGFTDHGSLENNGVITIDSIWSYVREDNGMTLRADMISGCTVQLLLSYFDNRAAVN
jgi:hypothetical protein